MEDLPRPGRRVARTAKRATWAQIILNVALCDMFPRLDLAPPHGNSKSDYLLLALGFVQTLGWNSDVPRIPAANSWIQLDLGPLAQDAVTI